MSKKKDADWIYPTFEEALRITDETEDQWKPAYMKTVSSLLEDAFNEPTGVAYTALKVSDIRRFIVLCVVGTLENNKAVISDLTEKGDANSVLDTIPEDLLIGDIVKNAMELQAVIIAPIKQPYAVIMAGADPASVEFIEKTFELSHV